MIKLYNTGTEVFEFTYGGNIYTLLPKHGTYRREKEPYEVIIPGLKGKRDVTMKRTRDVWVKVSDEGRNSNWAEMPEEAVPVARKLADSQGILEHIQRESVVLKAEEDKIEALEARVKEKEEELKRAEKENAMKLAMLQKIEQEAVKKVAARK